MPRHVYACDYNHSGFSTFFYHNLDQKSGLRPSPFLKLQASPGGPRNCHVHLKGTLLKFICIDMNQLLRGETHVYTG